MGGLREIEAYHGKHHVFNDRRHAGKLLGELLKAEYGKKDMVLAIPSGGVPVGIAVAEILECPMDLLIVRKLKIPGNPEAGFGAITHDGSIFLNEALLYRLDINPEQIRRESDQVKSELNERNHRLRDDRDFPEVKGKRVIIVDDGLASGYTMLAAIYCVKKRNAGEIVVGVPTAPKNTVEKMASGVEWIYCLNVREGESFAVADAYRNWRDLTDTEVSEMLTAHEADPETR